MCAVCWAPGPDNMTARTTDTGTGSGAMLTQLSVLGYRPVRVGSGVIVNGYQCCLIGRPRPVVVRLLTVISVGLSAHQDRQWCDVNMVTSVHLLAGQDWFCCDSAELSVLGYRPVRIGSDAILTELSVCLVICWPRPVLVLLLTECWFIDRPGPVLL